MSGKRMIAAWMWNRPAALGLACALLLPLVGCVGVNSVADTTIAAETMPRPDIILVHDFAITPEEVAPGRGGSSRLVGDTPRSATERAVGHDFAGAFAADLVAEIRRMGLPAARAGVALAKSGDVASSGNDTVSIEGQFVSVAAGDATAPGIVGFASGWPDAVADIQIYGTTKGDERLFEDLEFSFADAKVPPERSPASLLARLPTEPDWTGSAENGLPAATRADLERTAKATASAAAQQLAPFFADHGWIKQPAR